MASRYALTAAMLLTRFTEETLVQLTDGASAPDEAIVNTAIDSEENDFDGYAGVFFALPVRTSAGAVPGIVTEKLLDGVAIRLLCRKPEFVFSDQGELSAWWDRRMKALEAWKLALSDPARKVKLPDAVERGAVTETNSAAVKTSSVSGSYCAGFMTGGR